MKSHPIHQVSRKGILQTYATHLFISTGRTSVTYEGSLVSHCVHGWNLWWGRWRFSDWPAGPSLDPSCGCVDRFRFCWRLFLPVERELRIWTSLTLKNATMKGCFSRAPSRPTRPTSLVLMNCPVSEDKVLTTNFIFTKVVVLISRSFPNYIVFSWLFWRLGGGQS